MTTVKLKFHKDTFYRDLTKPEFIAGKVYDVSVENGFADRWIKRGAQIIEDVEVVEEKVLEPVQDFSVEEEDLLGEPSQTFEELEQELVEEVASPEIKEENKKGSKKIKGL